jgi:hypothetical protein
LIFLVTLTHSRNKEAAGARSDLKLESDLQQEISRSKASQSASNWAAPKLPASIIASIWTDRFVPTSTQQAAELRRYATVLGMMLEFAWKELPAVEPLASAPRFRRSVHNKG